MALRQLISQHSSEIGATFMLDEWEENLAIITANRTKDDELVVIHLGDCLWKERGEECCVWILLRFVTAAHICYLVAEANCESYSDTARICLIGADHLKFPRIYASPEAIQEGSSPDMQEKASGAVGLAALGEKNKFYYDENLKRWLEEGAEPPGDEPALPPPPPSASLQNRTADYTGPKIDNLHSNSELEYKSPSSEWNSGIPPTPPSSNHLSAYGCMGVRARYVDTFNKGGGTPANLFQSPSLLAAKSRTGPVGPNAKFFIPTLVASGDETVQTTGENL
ncbi:unnamed protein product [Camellia sinensis]